MCVCVCERERERYRYRESERVREREIYRESERERERECGKTGTNVLLLKALFYWTTNQSQSSKYRVIAST